MKQLSFCLIIVFLFIGCSSKKKNGIYVQTVYKGKIQVFSKKTYKKMGSYRIQRYARDMDFYQGKIYVTVPGHIELFSKGGNAIQILDLNTRSINTIKVSGMPDRSDISDKYFITISPGNGISGIVTVIDIEATKKIIEYSVIGDSLGTEKYLSSGKILNNKFFLSLNQNSDITFDYLILQEFVLTKNKLILEREFRTKDYLIAEGLDVFSNKIYLSPMNKKEYKYEKGVLSKRSKNNKEILVISLDSFKIIKIIKLKGESPFLIKINPNNKKGYVTHFDSVGNYNQLSVIDVERDVLLKTINLPYGRGLGIDIDKKTGYVYVTNQIDRSFSVIHPDTDKIIKTIKLNDSPKAILVL